MELKKEDYVLAVALVLFLIVLYSVISNVRIDQDGVSQSECTENQSRSCFSGPCMGSQVCTNGSWSRCTWDIVCKPNSVAPCQDSVCAGFFRTCNACGTEYGPCVESGKES